VSHYIVTRRICKASYAKFTIHTDASDRLRFMVAARRSRRGSIALIKIGQADGFPRLTALRSDRVPDCSRVVAMWRPTSRRYSVARSALQKTYVVSRTFGLEDGHDSSAICARSTGVSNRRRTGDT
jgi:hypothetical protein